MHTKSDSKKRDYDTWCSQVVSNPSTNQALKGLTSLIRREVVLSSWYGRNSLCWKHPIPSTSTQEVSGCVMSNNHRKVPLLFLCKQSVFVGICQSANWQHANHTNSEEKGEDDRDMASSQGVSREGWKREKEGGVWLLDGVEVSVMACFFNSCQCLHIHPSWVVEGQSHVSWPGFLFEAQQTWHSPCCHLFASLNNGGFFIIKCFPLRTLSACCDGIDIELLSVDPFWHGVVKDPMNDGALKKRDKKKRQRKAFLSCQSR